MLDANLPVVTGLFPHTNELMYASKIWNININTNSKFMEFRDIDVFKLYKRYSTNKLEKPNLVKKLKVRS